MMETTKQFCILMLLPLVSMGAWAQNDTTSTEVQRTVTVERDYQPAIEQAEKMNESPRIVHYDLAPQEVVWSRYSYPLQVEDALQTLPAAELNISHPQHGSNILQGAIGHRNTDFRFLYQGKGKRGGGLKLFADHDGLWGRQTLSDTKAGFAGAIAIGQSQFYFGADGQNSFYSRYARYFDGGKGLTVTKMSDMKQSDWQHLWSAHTRIGLRSTNKDRFQYRFQTGYNILHVPALLSEHQVQSHVDIGWKTDQHHFGADMSVYNHFYSAGPELQIAPSQYNPRHAIRIEPFYAYRSEHLHVHAGVHVDINIGKGQLLSSSPNISFAPSPNVHADWTFSNNRLNVYTDIQGSFGIGSVDGWLKQNRYFAITPTEFKGLTTQHVSAYTPMDATLGLRIHPLSTMLIDLHMGYAICKNQYDMTPASLSLRQLNPETNMNYLYTDYKRFRLGASLFYHWRDIIEIQAGARYFHYSCDTIEAAYMGDLGKQVYDRPSWEADIRVDWHITSKWSVYSDNRFAGATKALIVDENGQYSSATLRPTIILNAGVNFAFNKWLNGYIQVDNCLNRRHDIWYGYQSQGIHFLLGVKWQF